MYVHIGSDRIVRLCDIVGIFDLDGEITTEDTGEFLKGADAAGITSLAGDDLPRSFVVISPKADMSPDAHDKKVYEELRRKKRRKMSAAREGGRRWCSRDFRRSRLRTAVRYTDKRTK